MLAVVALVATLGLIGIASGTSAGAGGFTCFYTVEPAVLGPDGGPVTVSGNAPGTSLVQIFFDPLGAPGPFIIVGDVPTEPVTGFFEANFVVTQSGEVTVGVDGYASDLCVGSAGGGQGAGGAGARRGNLPRTGSSSTSVFVVAGLAALALGTALVAGARRWNSVRSA